MCHSLVFRLMWKRFIYDLVWVQSWNVSAKEYCESSSKKWKSVLSMLLTFYISSEFFFDFLFVCVRSNNALSCMKKNLWNCKRSGYYLENWIQPQMNISLSISGLVLFSWLNSSFLLCLHRVHAASITLLFKLYSCQWLENISLKFEWFFSDFALRFIWCSQKDGSFLLQKHGCEMKFKGFEQSKQLCCPVRWKWKKGGDHLENWHTAIWAQLLWAILIKN